MAGKAGRAARLRAGPDANCEDASVSSGPKGASGMLDRPSEATEVAEGRQGSEIEVELRRQMARIKCENKRCTSQENWRKERGGKTNKSATQQEQRRRRS